MSDLVTRRMIAAYIKMAAAMMFLTGFFRTPAENFHSSEEIEIDIERSEEDISIVVTDLSTGYRMNSDDLYTNKAFKPPIHKEGIALNAFDLIKRVVGENPFEDPGFRANLIVSMMKKMKKIENKIRRSIELQASQVLQSGTVTLSDENGVALYTIDYKPKVAHFPTVSTDWGDSGYDPIGDLGALAEVIRTNGRENPDQLIFGATAFDKFISNTKVQTLLDNRRMDVGDIGRPETRGQGGTSHGTFSIGQYTYQLWTYNAVYKHQQTGTLTPFVAADKVIMRATTGRLDATFGAIPNIGAMLGKNGRQLVPELPGRFDSPESGIDLHTNVWLSPDGEQIFGGVGSRPLLIPTAIDTFGCLDTVA